MDLPLTKQQTLLVANWMETHFGDKLKAATQNTKFNENHLIAIACQESAGDWIMWIEKHTPDEILAACVSDPTGDQPGTVRNVWPQNLLVFQKDYPTLAPQLVEAGNVYRAMKGWTARNWLYKAYGIFQYDIQAIKEDKVFFEQQQWKSMDYCLERVMMELKSKIELSGDIWGAIKHYNGSGKAADQYMLNVKQFYDWITIN